MIDYKVSKIRLTITKLNSVISGYEMLDSKLYDIASDVAYMRIMNIMQQHKLI